MSKAALRWLAITLVSLAALAAFSGLVLAQSQGPPSPIVLWSAQGPVAVERDAELEAAALDPEGLLSALLEGPTAEERAQGLRSAIPQGTTLAGLQRQPDGTVIVRLEMPSEALQALDHGAFEIIVHQIGYTLEPLNWRDLRIQIKDTDTGAFVPLADFLPEIPPPRKEPLPDEGGESQLAPADTGPMRWHGPSHGIEPPAPGQGQPQGALTGKTVYVSAGHGWLWNDYVDDWRTQRPPYPNPAHYEDGSIIEDHNNAEAVNQYLLQYLWNAGAMVWPVRERDMNGEMAVVDNDDPAPGYCETGSWATTSLTGTGYADSDYRYTNTVTGTPTATASWTATLPADGRYAVYVWYRPGPDRAPDARYTVHHAGGETTVAVDQRHHGITWHYIGTYGFRAGEEARVTLTNQSAFADRLVVADAVRFGGGTFDDLNGIDTAATHAPNKPWWEVAAYYHVQRMGWNPPYGDVTARPTYARWEHKYTGDDAVYVSWHTNGVSGYQTHSRGTLSIVHNGDGGPITPGSEALRETVHNELVQDIQAGWDASWPGYTRRMNLGELRELWDDEIAQDPNQRQIPGALFEIAYHDHPGDTDALKEPTFEMLAARAMYQGIVKYFEQRDGVDLTLLPEPPTHPTAQNLAGGAVRISWQPSPTDALDLAGDPATGYRVYTSTNGIGWSNGITVTSATTHTLTDLSPGQLIYVRVSATNEGGESFPTETLAVRVGDPVEVLLVNGFDRLNNTMLVLDDDPVEDENMRMFLDQMNRYDYVIQHAEVISYPFDSASNEAVQSGQASLSDYALVDWILGEESAPDETLDATERALLRSFLASGGALFISGAEIGWHLDYVGADPAFYNDVLRADYVDDDAGTYRVAPVSGSIFDGLSPFQFDAPGMYDADWPDVIRPTNGSRAALVYEGWTRDTAAAIQYENGCERLVTFGFPFETIWPNDRPAVMARILDFLDECLRPAVDTSIDSPVYGSAHNTVPPFEGTAQAPNASLQRVEVQIERLSDGRYWTGGSWSTEASWLTAAGAEAWSYALPTPLTDSGYHLRARAWTTDSISDTSPAETTFIYDTIPPVSTTLITPTGGVTISALPSARLVWEDVGPDGGSDLLYRVDLDGQPYTTTNSPYTVTHVAEGPHTWGVQVLDAAGHESDRITDTFFVSRRHLWLPLILRDFEEAPATCTDVIVNGGFESEEGWLLNNAAYDTTEVKSDARSARVGILPHEPGTGADEDTYSSVRQQVTLPQGSSATLRLWVYPISENNDPDDRHYIWLDDQWEGVEILDLTTSDTRDWEQREYDLSAYLGQTVTLYIGARNDGDDDTAAMYVDDVELEVCP